jgi:hypothetical protein
VHPSTDVPARASNGTSTVKTRVICNAKSWNSSILNTIKKGLLSNHGQFLKERGEREISILSDDELDLPVGENSKDAATRWNECNNQHSAANLMEFSLAICSFSFFSTDPASPASCLSLRNDPMIPLSKSGADMTPRGSALVDRGERGDTTARCSSSSAIAP